MTESGKPCNTAQAVLSGKPWTARRLRYVQLLIRPYHINMVKVTRRIHGFGLNMLDISQIPCKFKFNLPT